MIRTVVCLIAVASFGCSKPAEVALPVRDKPGGTATAQRVDVSTLLKSKADILVELKRRGFVLEPFELSVPVPGVTVFKLSGAPLGVAFTEHDDKLREVEAMALAGMEEKHVAELLGFAKTIGEVATGFPRDELGAVIEQITKDVGTTPQGISRTVNDGTYRVKVDVRRHADGGYSFRFIADSDGVK